MTTTDRSAAPERRPTRDRLDLPATAFLIGFSAILGLNQALVKLVNEAFSPLFQAGLRSACALALILLYVWLTGRRLTWRRDTLWLGTLNGLLFALEFALLFAALDLSGVARISLLFYTMPCFVALGAHFLFPGESLTVVKVLGLALAVGGVAIAMLSRAAGAPPPDAAMTAGSPLLGDVLALSAAACWAGIVLLTRASRLSSLPPEQNLIYQLAVSAIVLIALAPVFGEPIRIVTAPLLGVFAFQVFTVASFGFLIWLWVLSIYPVSNMSSFSLLTPLFGVAAGWAMFDDQINASFGVALALVVLGLIAINWPARR